MIAVKISNQQEHDQMTNAIQLLPPKVRHRVFDDFPYYYQEPFEMVISMKESSALIKKIQLLILAYSENESKKFRIPICDALMDAIVLARRTDELL